MVGRFLGEEPEGGWLGLNWNGLARIGNCCLFGSVVSVAVFGFRGWFVFLMNYQPYVGYLGIFIIIIIA